MAKGVIVLVVFMEIIFLCVTWQKGRFSNCSVERMICSDRTGNLELKQLLSLVALFDND